MDKYWDRINAIYHRQEAKGLKKYGMPLEANPSAIQTRLTYLEEELVDGLSSPFRSRTAANSSRFRGRSGLVPSMTPVSLAFFQAPSSWDHSGSGRVTMDRQRKSRGQRGPQ